MNCLLLATLIALCAAAAHAATRAQLLRLHRVSRKDYNELLRLTNGQRDISAGRRITNPIVDISEIGRTVRLPSFLDKKTTTTRTTPNKKVGYPLCVISPGRLDNERSVSALSGFNSWFVPSGTTGDSDNSGLIAGGSSFLESLFSPSSTAAEEDSEANTSTNTPAVNCVLVVNGEESPVIRPVPPVRTGVAPYPGYYAPPPYGPSPYASPVYAPPVYAPSPYSYYYGPYGPYGPPPPLSVPAETEVAYAEPEPQA